MRKPIALVLVSVLILIFSISVSSQNSTARNKPAEWLVAGPVVTSAPLFDTLPDINGKKFNSALLLNAIQLPSDTALPESSRLSPFGGQKWQIQPFTKGRFTPVTGNDKSKTLWLGAVYVTLPRYASVEFDISSSFTYELWLNGEKLASGSPSDGKPATGKPSAKLTRGKHLLLVKLLADQSVDGGKQEGFSFETSNKDITFTTNPGQSIDLAHVLEGTSVTGCDISNSGEFYRLNFNTVFKGEGKSESETGIYAFSDHHLVWSNTDDKISSINFTPDGRAISYLQSNGEGKQFVIENLATGKKSITGGFDKVDNYGWSPDGKFLIYSISEDGPKEKDIARHIENPNDRWPWYRNRSLLGRYCFETRIHDRLTWGYRSTDLQSIAHDGSFILFSTSDVDFTTRPYSRQQLYRLDLLSGVVTRIWDFAGGAAVTLSPDDKTLLVTGAPTLFNNIGNVLPEGTIPNEYDTQAFLYDLASGEITPLTRNFNPKVNEAAWAANGQQIVLLTENRTRADIFVTDLKGTSFRKITGMAEVTSGMAVSPLTGRIAAFGTSVSAPSVAWTTTVSENLPSPAANPSKSFFRDIAFGNVEDYVFTTENGDSIDGMVFYPPDFNPAQKYPVIVYYYAGTSPINRSFEGRYPKNLFAAMGYIVYTLNPDGCTGYGAEFAARHVNNWGTTTADQIIEGTKKFLRTHPAADSTRVGCIGASYGGFMTMLLQTRTDIFRTAIAHAGISNLSSYWGEGYWGYLYSSAATADKFPWNDPVFYANQSPLFNADKVQNSILLLHGNKDTNVPTAESHQLFTALTLLGKKVELIEFDEQNHQILSYKPRIKWQNTIFAWFAKWLQDDPAWWDELYPERKM
ncbi:MAG TPA: hypothetical protein DEO70_11140 [Bacteroidales bacterium]|nr:MAG: hypothetical protein A2X11_05630 [Bacteroidetes bacterium GWE2_42_24]OFY30506.1 MAG: hypothetical protein A2X09_16610 [Bacteroidetes bacterium GWF2_43_11]HBZ67382.1 hypothetical protein [Bacteroidales bacterium]